jgi:hypothetical protein
VTWFETVHLTQHIPQYLSKEISDSVLKTQIQFVPLDFFKDSPVQDCDIYYV